MVCNIYISDMIKCNIPLTEIMYHMYIYIYNGKRVQYLVITFLQKQTEIIYIIKFRSSVYTHMYCHEK